MIQLASLKHGISDRNKAPCLVWIYPVWDGPGTWQASLILLQLPVSSKKHIEFDLKINKEKICVREGLTSVYVEVPSTSRRLMESIRGVCVCRQGCGQQMVHGCTALGSSEALVSAFWNVAALGGAIPTYTQSGRDFHFILITVCNTAPGFSFEFQPTMESCTSSATSEAVEPYVTLIWAASCTWWNKICPDRK